MADDTTKTSPAGFHDLVAWQLADELASLVYRAFAKLPPNHRWLADQTMRAAISVPANIAKGHGRGSLGELLRFIDIARGSLSELEYYIHFLAKESLLPSEEVAVLQSKRTEVGRVPFGLWRSLKATSKDNWDHTGRIREEGPIYEVTP